MMEFDVAAMTAGGVKDFADHDVHVLVRSLHVHVFRPRTTFGSDMERRFAIHHQAFTGHADLDPDGILAPVLAMTVRGSDHDMAMRDATEVAEKFLRLRVDSVGDGLRRSHMAKRGLHGDLGSIGRVG